MEKLVEHVLHLVSTSDVVPEHLSVFFVASNKLDLLYLGSNMAIYPPR